MLGLKSVAKQRGKPHLPGIIEVEDCDSAFNP